MFNKEIVEEFVNSLMKIVYEYYPSPISKTIYGYIDIPMEDGLFREVERQLNDLGITLVYSPTTNQFKFSVTPMAHKNILVAIKLALKDRDFE